MIKIFSDISNNKYFLGIMMIIVNIGSRFIIEEITPKQKEYINSKLFRRIVIFAIFYVATREIVTSILLTLVFVLFISELFIDGTVKDDNKDIKNGDIIESENILIQDNM